MIKEIEKDLEKLQVRCDELDTRKENAEMRQIIIDLKDTLRANENGCGLSANQIGYDKRIFVINFNGDLRSFINPIISEAKGLTINREGCLSIPDKEFLRPRNTEITVLYQTPLGKVESRKLFGLAAMVFQHELDHLDGLTLEDIGLEVDENFDKASDDEKAEVIKAYMDSLDIKQKDIAKEIEEDPELKKQNDAIKFMERLAKGEIELGEPVTKVKHRDENEGE